uniref:Uncharacterized protein n=1 Tax=Anguilla anguilla TaxID=7936 RepID=A0A0E9S245_ANGAN
MADICFFEKANIVLCNIFSNGCPIFEKRK